MLWQLRMFWYRADKGAWLFAMYVALVLGLLALAAREVERYQEAQRERARELQLRSLDCLARNVYYEARGEPISGQYAVAEVTMNRTASPGFPGTVCDVVYQRAAFSWTELGPLPEPRGDAWVRAQRIAEDVYFQRREPTLRGALYFHASYVRPEWAQERHRLTKIGRHIFYR